jgi:uncharacterized protein (TIGR03435 family)
MRHRLVVIGLLAVAAVAAAQTPSPAAGNSADRTFEVASVKLAPPFVPGPGAVRPSLAIAGTHFDVHSYRLLDLLTWTYNPGPGAFAYPDWLRNANSVRLDIQAVMPQGSSKADVQAMVKALLVERMGLQSHVEPRIVPSFDLVVAPGGIKMKAVEEADEREKQFPTQQYELDNRSTDGERRTIVSLAGGNRTLTARSNFVTIQVPIDARPTKYTFDATRITMADFVQELTYRVEKPVIDATGLTGVYQFRIEVPIPESTLRIARTVIPRAGAGDQADLDVPSSVSVPKQLESIGLSLVERKAPIDVMVIDSIEKVPTDN